MARPNFELNKTTFDCQTCGLHGLSTSNRSRHFHSDFESHSAESLQDLFELPRQAGVIDDADSLNSSSDNSESGDEDGEDHWFPSSTADVTSDVAPCASPTASNDLPKPPNNWFPFPSAEVTKLTYWFLESPRIKSRRMSQLLHILREPGFDVSNLPKSFKTFRKFAANIPRATVHFDTLPVTAVTRVRAASGEQKAVEITSKQVR